MAVISPAGSPLARPIDDEAVLEGVDDGVHVAAHPELGRHRLT
jgi:hypothetical protein